MNKDKIKKASIQDILANTHVIHDVGIIVSTTKHASNYLDLLNNINKKKKQSYYSFLFNLDLPRDYLNTEAKAFIPETLIYSLNDNGLIRTDKLELFFKQQILPHNLNISVYFYIENKQFHIIGFGKNHSNLECFDADTFFSNKYLPELDKILMKTQTKKSNKAYKVVKF